MSTATVGTHYHCGICLKGRSLQQVFTTKKEPYRSFLIRRSRRWKKTSLVRRPCQTATTGRPVSLPTTKGPHTYSAPWTKITSPFPMTRAAKRIAALKSPKSGIRAIPTRPEYAAT